MIDDAMVVRHLVDLAMSFDHRRVDSGKTFMVLAPIGAFLQGPATATLVG
ncbi:MAG: hypothetical protein ACYCPT_07065 [Acidimicrobiales bacterium]